MGAQGFNWTLAMLSGQRREMSLTIDELCHRLRSPRKPSHTPPRGSPQTGLGALCFMVVAPGLAARDPLASRRDARARCTRRDSSLAGHGTGGTTLPHARPPYVASATQSACPGSQLLGGPLSTGVVPPGATVVRGRMTRWNALLDA
jgi:hypothetical protein